MLTPIETVRTFWSAIQDRDWSAVRDRLAPDVVVDYVETGERFIGPDHVVAINAEYPEGWSIHVLRLLEAGPVVVAEVEVPQQGVGIFRVAAVMEVEGGRIRRSTEYWLEVGSEGPPAWRRDLARRFVTDGDAS